MPKPPLILLHGALGAADQFASWVDFLSADFEVHIPEFEGHGKRPSPDDRPFRMTWFEENLADYIKNNQLQSPAVFGFSMGGYAALCLAKNQPGLISRIFTFATKFDWSPVTAAGETKMLKASKIREKVPAFAKTLEERHSASGWESVLEKTAQLMLDLGQNPPLNPENAGTIEIPVRFGIGDRDTMVGLEETMLVFRALPQGELFVMPKTAHPIEKIQPSRITDAIRDFFLLQ